MERKNYLTLPYLTLPKVGIECRSATYLNLKRKPAGYSLKIRTWRMGQTDRQTEHEVIAISIFHYMTVT